MHLSGLELHGFKSFPKKTKLTFSPGVMAIVGPNGCGKSNIVDAVRWVLGEQRTSVLRSDKMESVIFAGADSMKPLNQAEVTLVIENSHGILPAEYSEVAITRRLSREGDSEYLLNRRPVRLKDIRALFADTGLGPDSYSIIELKMVEGILSNRTDERRRLFEEAAGVTMYKQNLHRARLRLNSTSADMIRLEDVLSEITTSRNSLKRQVSKAKRYRYLREALRVKEITAANKEIGELRAKVVPLEQRLESDRTRRESLRAEVEKGDEELSRRRARVGEMENRLAELRKEREALETRSQTAQREMVMLEERLRSGLRRGEERDQEEQELVQRRGEIAEQIEQQDEQRQQARERAEEIKLRLASMDESWNEYEARAVTVRNERDAREAERRAAESDIARLETEQEQVAQRQEFIGRRLVELEVDVRDGETGPDIEPLREEVERKRGELEAAEKAIEQGRAALEELREQRGDAQRAETKAERDLAAAGKRVDLFEGMVRRGEGRPKAVRELLSSGLPGLAGRLGDAVKVADEDRLAVAAALEEVASAVVAESGDARSAAARFLAEGERGRGLIATGSQSSGGTVPQELGSAAGVLGPMSDRVQPVGAAGAVALRQLRRVLLVEDFDTLLRLADTAAAAGWTLVTPEGSRLSPEGVLAVGEVDAGDIGAEALLEDARVERDEAERRVEGARTEVARLQQQEKSAGEELSRAGQTRAEARRALDEANVALGRGEADLREHETLQRRRAEEIEQLREEKQELEQRQANVASRLKVARATIAEIEEAFGELTSRLETVEEEGRSLRSARDRLREQQVEASGALERLQGEVRRHGAMLDEIGRRLERIKQERVDSAGALEDAQERLRHVQGEEAVVSRELEELLERQKGQTEQFTELRRNFAELDGQLSGQRSELAQISDRIHASELELADLRHRLTNVRQRILEEYEIDLITARQEELPLAFQEENPYMENPLGEIREALKSIGPVNHLALEEYEVVDARWQKLTRQHEDLRQAIETLEATIKEINGVARKRFLETFTRVEGHFVSLFSRLFGGGEASLSLAEGDPLEAGIQIFASPKGKKPSTIDLLSGGEKAMTAISLLFALYLERPSPFCFLDEVDAPLDDVNVVRFNRLLREFTDRTQFLTVTHNKLTMERADRLYGVTMEEDGISTMVAVEIGKRDAV